MKPWKEIVDSMGSVILGETKVDLMKDICEISECNLGNFVADAFVHAMVHSTTFGHKFWTSTAISFITSGSMRVPLFRGNLTYAHLVAMSPFENRLIAFNLSGKKLLEALEYSARDFNASQNTFSSYSLMQVSGLKVTYDIKSPVGQRVIELKVRCADCEIPKYENFDERKQYRLVASNYHVDGGGGFTMIRDYATDKEEIMKDIEAIVLYTKAMTPIYTGIEKRITIVN